MDTDILATLLAQHKDLRKKIEEMKSLAILKIPVFNAILEGVSLFNLILRGHLELENKIFYPEILAKMERKNLDTHDTKIFISKMKEIEAKIDEFVIKYDSVERIKEGFKGGVYQKHLDNTASALLMRLESEEEGVYMYWKL